MMNALINANILTPEGFCRGQSILIDDGIIIDICADSDRPSGVKIDRDLAGMRLCPGLIDLQVNGGGGVLFNDCPSVEGIKSIGKAHRAFGTTGFFPTLISDDLDVMASAIEAVDAAIMAGVPGVLGIHLEGPFLNQTKRGVHDASKFAVIGDAEIDLLSRLKHGKTLVTLAPEMTTPEVIKSLKARGIILSAGHSHANYEQTLDAMDAGLMGFTHLFNAMTPLASRAPGMIAAALEDARAWCGIIADGHHVHPAMLRLAIRAKTEDQIFLVTDAMSSVGSADKSFHLGDMEVTVDNGKCVTSCGTLAGSDLDMIGAVLYAVNELNIAFEQAVRMASIIPAKFMGLGGSMGEIRPGHKANFVLLNEDNHVVDSWIDGVAANETGEA